MRRIGRAVRNWNAASNVAMRSTVTCLLCVTIAFVGVHCDARVHGISAQIAPSPATATPPSTAAPSSPAPPGPGVRIIVAPDHLDVTTFVSRARAEAAAQHRRVLVYVGAEWCPPCLAFRSAVEAHRLDQAFPDLTLLEFDYDLDASRLRAAGYVSRLVPYFTVPRADGHASTARVEGSIHDAESVDEIVPRLHALLDTEATR